MWGALAGIGAHLLVAGVVLAVTFIAQLFVYLDNSALFYTAFGVAAAAGMAAAMGVGGRRAAAIFAVYCAIGMVTDVAQAWFEEQRVRSLGDCCYVLRSATEVALWQTLTIAGLVIGGRLTSRLPTWSVHTRAALESAGAYALASLPMLVVFPVYDPRVTPFLVWQAPEEWHVAIVVVQSALAGLVLAYRSTKVSALVAAAAIGLIGFVTVAFADLSTWLHVPLHGWTYWPQSLVLVPLAGAAIALIMLAGRLAVRRATRRAPTGGSSPF